LLRVLRPARACLAEDLVSDLVHATREAALRRDSRGGIRATAGKTVFPSPFFFPLRYWENVESVSRFRRKGKGRRSIGLAGMQSPDAVSECGIWMRYLDAVSLAAE
jgi:hypothetical protein